MMDRRATEPRGDALPAGTQPPDYDPGSRQRGQSPADEDGGPAPAGLGDGDVEHRSRLRVPIVTDHSGDDRGPAAVYLRASADPTQIDKPIQGVEEAHRRASRFASRYGYPIIGRFQDVTDLPLPSVDSAFGQLLEQIDAGVIRVVLIPSAIWLAPIPEAQQRMAAMIADHGATLVLVDASTALGITPSGR
ncbi:hypothetical protein [Cryptosporangium sp. NPDC051539]|uniref:hypothetical protein n=1 Tax=Cryptosporangium sp. NPDC051539 TaxID=3363962 RepID=UPI0037B4FB2B